MTSCGVAGIKMVYLAPADIQVARVDRQCIVHFCDALSQLGVQVELVALRIKLVPDELWADDPLSLYRVRNGFPARLVRVPVGQDSRGLWLAANRLVVHTREAVRYAVAGRG